MLRYYLPTFIRTKEMPSSKCNTDEITDNKLKAKDDASRNNDYVQSSRANFEGQEDPTATRTELLNEAREQDGTQPPQGHTSVMLRVATKTHDGGQVSSTQDAFMLYSDDITRMMTILGLHDRGDGQVDNDVVEEFNQWRQDDHVRRRIGEDGDDESDGQDSANDNGNEPSSPERKTRISFELHDSVYMFLYR